MTRAATAAQRLRVTHPMQAVELRQLLAIDHELETRQRASGHPADAAGWTAAGEISRGGIRPVRASATPADRHPEPVEPVRLAAGSHANLTSAAFELELESGSEADWPNASDAIAQPRVGALVGYTLLVWLVAAVTLLSR